MAIGMPSLVINNWKRLVLGLVVVLLGCLMAPTRLTAVAATPLKISADGSVRLMRPLVKLQSHRISSGPTNLTAPVTRVVIQPGDTLWSLAGQLGTTVGILESLNHLTSSVIDAGAELIVPLNEESAESNGVTATSHDLTRSSPATDGSPAPATAKTAAGVPNLLNPVNVNLLAHLVQAEAGTQPLLGQVAVGAVVLNRLKASGFPKTLSGVIEQPGQFESVSNGTFWRQPSPTAILAAQDALKGWDPTGGALFYYNPSLPHSSWMNGLAVTTVIGAQVFCR